MSDRKPLTDMQTDVSAMVKRWMRPTQWCDQCESTVYADDVHSCFSARAVREQQERERALTVAERAVVEAAERFEDAWYIASVEDTGIGPTPLERCTREIAALSNTVRAMRNERERV